MTEKKISFAQLNNWLKAGFIGGFLFFIMLVIALILEVIERFLNYLV